MFLLRGSSPKCSNDIGNNSRKSYQLHRTNYPLGSKMLPGKLKELSI